MTWLNFSIPHFFRHAWTSDSARRLWEPRIRAVAVAVSRLQWLSVAHNMRPCGIARLTPPQFQANHDKFERNGLETTSLGRESCATGYQPVVRAYVSGQPFQDCIAFGKKGAGSELALAVTSGDDRAVGELLGYPDCCINSFLALGLGEKCSDNTWFMAKASACGSPTFNESRMITIKEPSQASVLLKGLGVRAVFHLPCRFDCPESMEWAEQIIHVGRKEGLVSEMEWLGEMLHWPIEWSALHGIAEIKTAILKCSTSTEATAELYRVLVGGSTFPEESARGIGHAYQDPGKKTPRIP